LVLHPHEKSERGGVPPQEKLAEAVGLARAIDLNVVHAEAIAVAAWNPGTLLGSGTVERCTGLIAAESIKLVFVDHTVSPVQQRNLEKAWSCKVLDRTGLILEIFADRARTAEGRLQVELAQLTYQRGRLVRTWTHLERQRGGRGFLAGPGETQLEADRRMIMDKIERLKRRLDDVRRTRELHRKARRRVPYPIVALVGYTNAGKSTLFNRLVGAEVFAADLLFATLDPTMRALALPSGRKVILSDTVGFISDLPLDLVAAFRATLEEVIGADIIVHVRDMSSAHAEAQRRDVEAILRDLDLGAAIDSGVIIEALNKVDLLEPEARALLLQQSRRHPGAIPISAIGGEGIDDLVAAIERRLIESRVTIDLLVPHHDGATLAWLHRHGEVLASAAEEAGTRISVSLDPADAARFRKRGSGAEMAPTPSPNPQTSE
jgi:GTP-binding protein HflX